MSVRVSVRALLVCVCKCVCVFENDILPGFNMLLHKCGIYNYVAVDFSVFDFNVLVFK